MTGTESSIRLAVHHINAGNLRAAIIPLHRVLTTDPEHPRAHAYLAHCLCGTGRVPEARRAIATALALSPEDGYTRRIAGMIAIENGAYTEAEDHLIEARRLSPWDPFVHRWLACLYQRIGKRHLVLPTLQAGLRVVPDDPGLLASLAEALLDRGEIIDAVRAADNALRVDPESTEAHVAMGLIWLVRGDTDRANEHALMALRHKADHMRANRLLRLIKLRRHPLLRIFWVIATWMRQGTQATSVAFVKYSLIFVFCLLFNIADHIDRNLGRIVGASLLAIVFGLVLTAKFLRHLLSRKFDQVSLRGEF